MKNTARTRKSTSPSKRTKQSTTNIDPQEKQLAVANSKKWNRLVREVESLMDNSHRCNGSKPTRAEAEHTLAVISDFFMRWVDQRGSTAYAFELISDLMTVRVPDGVAQ